MESYIDSLPIDTQFWLSTFTDYQKLKLIGPAILYKKVNRPLTFAQIKTYLDIWTPNPDTGLRFSVKAFDKIRSYPAKDQFFVAMHFFIDDEPWCFGSCYYRTFDHPKMNFDPDDSIDYVFLDC